jgi:hypothetical protein
MPFNHVNGNPAPGGDGGAAAPNLDTGPGVAVPTVATAVTAAPAWLDGGSFVNTAVVDNVLTLTDTAGNVLEQIEVPPNGTLPYSWNDRPALGVKWSAAVAGMKGHLWGYV